MKNDLIFLVILFHYELLENEKMIQKIRVKSAPPQSNIHTY